MECNEYREGLATLAEGGFAPEAAAHVAWCASCGARLEELRRVVAAARLPHQRAPRSLVARAQALMRPAPRRLVARLLGSSLAGSGARLAGLDGFTLHVGAEDISVRLQYTPASEGWEVLGRAPALGWSVFVDSEGMACGPQGRFRIFVPNLDKSGFALRSPSLEIEVPPARELIDRAP